MRLISLRIIPLPLNKQSDIDKTFFPLSWNRFRKSSWNMNNSCHYIAFCHWKMFLSFLKLLKSSSLTLSLLNSNNCNGESISPSRQFDVLLPAVQFKVKCVRMTGALSAIGTKHKQHILHNMRATQRESHRQR